MEKGQEPDRLLVPFRVFFIYDKTQVDGHILQCMHMLTEIGTHKHNYTPHVFYSYLLEVK